MKKPIDEEIENFIRDCDGKFSATAARAKQMSKVDAKFFDSIFNESDHPRDEEGKFSTAAGGKSTEEHFKNAAGEWSPERKEVHNTIVKKLLGDFKATGENPKAYILGGGSASGKTSSFRKMKPQSSLNIDSDLIKEEIPEYEQLKRDDPERAAARVHEESSHLAKQAMALAIAKRIDFVLDSTGSGKKLPDVAKELHSRGYKVHAMYFDVPIDVARERSKARAQRTGRHIPEEVLQSTHQGSANGFMRLVESPHVSSAHAYNTTERVPALIYKRSGKETGIIIDDSKWQEYRRKSGNMMQIYKKPGANDSVNHAGVDSDVFSKDSDFESFIKLLNDAEMQETIENLTDGEKANS